MDEIEDQKRLEVKRNQNGSLEDKERHNSTYPYKGGALSPLCSLLVSLVATNPLAMFPYP